MVKRLLASAFVAALALSPTVAGAQQVKPIGAGTVDNQTLQAGGAAGSQTAQATGIGGLSTTTLVVGGVAVVGLGVGLGFALSSSSSTGTSTATN